MQRFRERSGIPGRWEYTYVLTPEEDEVVRLFLAFMGEKSNKVPVTLLRRLAVVLTDTEPEFDAKHDQAALCAACGHEYGRHFNPFENEEPGCKYCPCRVFVEPPCEPSRAKKSKQK